METSKTYKSFQYRNNLAWDTARRGRTSAPGKPDIEIGSPPEFKGDPGAWAPEEMLVAALNACMMLTFVSFAQSRGWSLWPMKAPQKVCWQTSTANTGLLKSAFGQPSS